MKKVLLSLLVTLIACSGGGGAGGGDSEIEVSESPISKCSLGSDVVKIMPIGDSITEAESGHNSYRRALWNNLKESGCNVDFVGSKSGVRGGLPLNEDFDIDHEGYWGYRVDQILPFISTKVATYSPDMVLIHLGSNDIFQEQSIESTIEELGSVIDQVRIHKADVVILLAQVIPSRRANDQLSLLNQEILKLGREKNSVVSPVIVVDQNSGYLVTDNYDGTHPLEIGEVKIADKWVNAILGSSH